MTMSGSQSGQQGWFHRATGTPFTQFIGVPFAFHIDRGMLGTLTVNP